MTDQDNDDEIRESIPCVTFKFDDDFLCLPVGYGLSDNSVRWRGVYLDDAYEGSAGAWQHAIEREKARRAKAKEQAEAAKVRLEEYVAYAGGLPISFVRGESPARDVIADLLRAMRIWGAEEDGIPDFAADVYDHAASLIGEPLIPENKP